MSKQDTDANEYSDYHRPWTDADVLRDLYVERELSQTECGEILGCSPSNISNWLDKHDIQARGPGEHNTPTDFGGRNALRQLYVEQGLTMAEIGERHDCHETTVLSRLREHNIPTRNQGAECSDPRLDDPGELRRLHHDEQLIAEEMADRFGCDRKTVLRRLREFDIPARGRLGNDYELTESVLTEQYVKEQRTAGEIGARVGCSGGTVLKRLRRFGIPVRTQEAPEAVADGNSLRRLYVDERLTAAEVADQTECHVSTVRRHLRTSDIDIRPPGPDTGVRGKLEDAELLHQHYVELKQSAVSIGDRFGCDGETVLRWLKRHGIPIREPGSRTSWPRLKDELYLQQQYITEDRLTSEIAGELGCTSDTVLRWLHIHDIEVTWECPTGEDCPAYIDGRSRERNYGGAIWQRARRKALRRDDHECQRCGLGEDEHLAEYARGLEVHHIIPFRTFDVLERAHQLLNLLTLCRPCHKTMEKLPIDNRHAGVPT